MKRILVFTLSAALCLAWPMIATASVQYEVVALTDTDGPLGPQRDELTFWSNSNSLDAFLGAYGLRPMLSQGGTVVFRALTDDVDRSTYYWTSTEGTLWLGENLAGLDDFQPVGDAGLAIVDFSDGIVYLDTTGSNPVVILDAQTDEADPELGDEVHSILPWPGSPDRMVFNDQGWSLWEFHLTEPSTCQGEPLCPPGGEVKKDICFLSPFGQRTVVINELMLFGPGNDLQFSGAQGYPALSSSSPRPQATFVTYLDSSTDTHAGLFRSVFEVLAPGESDQASADLLALEGETSAGLVGTDPLTFGFTGCGLPTFGSPAIDNQGDVAFRARAVTAGGDNRQGIWRVPAGATAPEQVALSGDATGITGQVFSVFGSDYCPYGLWPFADPVTAGNGDVVFAALTHDAQTNPLQTGDWHGGIWRLRNNVLTPLVFDGDAAAGMPGYTWNLGENAVLPSVAVDTAGRIAFGAEVESSSGSSIGIWLEDSTGQLQLVLALGQTLTLGPGDTAVVANLGIHGASPIGTQTGHPLWINDADEVLFVAYLDDGRQVLAKAAVPPDCPGQCLGDLDGDGLVDGADLGLLLAIWGTDHGCADLNGDGTVDGADLSVVLGAWGSCL